MMELSGIFVYPIKGMGGISLKTVNLEERGMQLDRRWMIVDENYTFISQRQVAKMALFKIEIEANHLKVYSDNEHILVPFSEDTYDRRANVKVWNDQVTALIASDQLNNWFSKHLGVKCYLAFQGKESKRLTSPKYTPSSEVSLADGYPFLMISERSVSFLNQKLTKPVEMGRFRANLIIKGDPSPHIEDDYQFYIIGGVKFKAIKPCARCNVITINQATTEQDPEPIQVLTKYRKRNNKIYFGQNLILEKSDHYTIKVGDQVDFLNKKIDNN